MKHELKIYPEWYNGLLSGLKTFEVRKDDRAPKFAPNDELFLREFDGDKYTGRTISALVRFVLRGKYCKDGYCIMSVEKMALMLMCPVEYDLNFNRKSECGGLMNRNCIKCCFDWLNSEATL